MSEQSSIGVALMARNAEQTLETCLASIRPYVDQIVIGVDTLTTDETERVAREGGADLIFPLTVSEWHECPAHGKVLAQHFAKARNLTFEKLDPDLDFYFWLDADDYVKGGEHFASVCQDVASGEAIGMWAPYHYATLAGGKATNTIFHRERLLRTKDQDGNPIGWVWQHRVHENVVPHSMVPPQWLLRDHPAIYHQEHGHSTSGSTLRNILLLEIDLEENPQDSRAIFYLGNQYFAAGNMAAAVGFYERLEGLGKNPYELWQARCYCSLAYERMGNLDAATTAAFRAIDINPRHPEPYYRLASIALLENRLDLVEYWTKQASTTEPSPPKEVPPFFVFKNPLDYNFNSKMPLADALAAQGRVREARGVLEEAYRVFPDERVKGAIDHYKALETAEEKASSFVRLLDGKDDTTVIETWEKLNLDPTTRQFGRVRGRVMPAYLRGRRGLSPRAIFWCNRAYEEWSPHSLTTTGIGGSETAVVEIAKRFHADGWHVDVYNGAGRYEGVHDGVGYWDPERLTREDACDLFVAWRQPKAYEQATRARAAVLWCHDLNYGPVLAEMKAWDINPRAIVCGVSNWHATYLRRVYGLDRVSFCPNGIDLSRFPHLTTKERPRKEPFQCVYASSPDRGLERLLRLWPRILNREPGVTLHIAYGWENIDKLIAMGQKDHQEFKDRLLGLSKATPEVANSVTWRGRLGQQALADLYSTSTVWAYPTSFLEVSCISGMEAMAAACVPVASTVGALPETVGDSGFLVPGLPDTKVWQDFWVDVLIGVLSTPQLRWPKLALGMQRVQDKTSDQAYERWRLITNNLLGSTNGMNKEREVLDDAGAGADAKQGIPSGVA